MLVEEDEDVDANDDDEFNVVNFVALDIDDLAT